MVGACFQLYHSFFFGFGIFSLKVVRGGLRVNTLSIDIRLLDGIISMSTGIQEGSTQGQDNQGASFLAFISRFSTTKGCTGGVGEAHDLGHDARWRSISKSAVANSLLKVRFIIIARTSLTTQARCLNMMVGVSKQAQCSGPHDAADLDPLTKFR